MEEFKDYSLGSRVFHELRKKIIQGEYEELAELREATVAKELGVSRTPVREAIRQLELEGLVKIIPNKGTYVTGITKKDIYDIYRMRSLLEGLSARMAAEHIEEQDLNKMEETILLSKFHLAKEKEEEVVELDSTFHEILYHASGSRMLERILTDFHGYVTSARTMSMKKAHRAQEAIDEHQQIFEAIRDRDADLAEKLANEHIQHVIENLNISL